MSLIRLQESLSGPATAETDTSALVAGLEFAVSTACTATAVYWWQAPSGGSTSVRQVGIFSATGGATALATASSAPTGTGWQRVAFPSPVSLPAGKYIAAVLHPNGKYSATGYFWFAYGSPPETNPGYQGLTDGILSAPNSANAVSNGAQGTFAGSATLVRPTDDWNHTHYWVDVEVDDAASGGGETTPLDTPVVTVVSTVNPSTALATDGSITVAWNPVANASRYEVGIAPGFNQVTGFTQVEDDATSPYTITGQGAGSFTVGVRAHPEA